MTRHYAGSRFALVLALYNTFVIRQRILKNSISITRSKNPHIVKLAAVGVGIGYFVGLSVIWLIPSFATESAVRMYYGVETATMAWMIEGKQVGERVFGDERRRQMRRRECIGERKDKEKEMQRERKM